MSDKIPETLGGLKRDVEDKVDDLERRLAEVERQLAERARLIREGRRQGPDDADDDTPSTPPETAS